MVGPGPCGNEIPYMALHLQSQQDNTGTIVRDSITYDEALALQGDLSILPQEHSIWLEFDNDSLREVEAEAY